MQHVEAGAVIIGDADLLLVARLVYLGLTAMERHDGGAPDGFRVVAAELCRAAEVSRARIEREARRSRAGSGTSKSRRIPAAPLSGRWLTTVEVADLLGIDESYARRLARKGRLRARRTGTGAWEFDPAAAATARQRASRTELETAA